MSKYSDDINMREQFLKDVEKVNADTHTEFSNTYQKVRNNCLNRSENFYFDFLRELKKVKIEEMINDKYNGINPGLEMIKEET